MFFDISLIKYENNGKKQIYPRKRPQILLLFLANIGKTKRPVSPSKIGFTGLHRIDSL